MIAAQNVSPGMVIELEGTIYRVESTLKVSLKKGSAFYKMKLQDLASDHFLEKNIGVDEHLKEVKLSKHQIEYLYVEGKNHVFLDIQTLAQVKVDQGIIGEKVEFLKEGVLLEAKFYGDSVFDVALPPFLELMVVKVEDLAPTSPMAATSRLGVLETGARIEVPMFIESGDVVKIDTATKEYVQRI